VFYGFFWRFTAHGLFVVRPGGPNNEKRDLISRALGVQIPNPGSVSHCAGREIFDLSPHVGAAWDHFATVSLSSFHYDPFHSTGLLEGKT
jgi:hypothetical protein